MAGLRKNPHLYQANALVYLRRAEQKAGKKLTLSSIPAKEWKELVRQGFDLLWLMGIWQRSPAAREQALNIAELRQAYDKVLPGWKPEDVAGSPYAVHSYIPDERFGSADDLKKLRAALNAADLRLILDFVPNHLAFDHPATLSNPEYFITGTAEQAAANTGLFFKTAEGRFLAHGKDPFFLPWSDTVQINFFSEAARRFLLATLMKIAETADGVRCDMAMLGMNSVFPKTWKDFVKEERPKTEFWVWAIAEVKKKYPDFIFLAEVYWDREWELQQMGFDYTYDKKLYDRLLHDNGESVLGHLNAEQDYSDKCARFIENHDEERAVEAFGAERSKAAAVVMATVPGMRFFQDGQLEGKRIHLPVQLGREPEETPDSGISGFYKNLLSYADDNALHDGEWQLLEASPANLLAWVWRRKNAYRVVLVNYSDRPLKGKVKMPKGFMPPDREVEFKPWEFQLLD